MATKRKVKVIQARYVPDADSILIYGECAEGKFHQHIHRGCFSYGDRTETEIVEELEKTAAMMVGRSMDIIFDPLLDQKMKKGTGSLYDEYDEYEEEDTIVER